MQWLENNKPTTLKNFQLRILGSNSLKTEEFNKNRINIYLNENNQISAVEIG